jgi:hypothetical protein
MYFVMGAGGYCELKVLNRIWWNDHNKNVCVFKQHLDLVYPPVVWLLVMNLVTTQKLSDIFACLYKEGKKD